MIKKCNCCQENIRWKDEVVLHQNYIFHVHCVTLVPTGYIILNEDKIIGESDNYDGEVAFMVLEDYEYEED